MVDERVQSVHIVPRLAPGEGDTGEDVWDHLGFLARGQNVAEGRWGWSERV